MDDENDRAALYIGLSQRTLEKMRTQRLGPQFRKHGRYVRYHIDELDEWSKGRQQEAGSKDGGRS